MTTTPPKSWPPRVWIDIDFAVKMKADGITAHLNFYVIPDGVQKEYLSLAEHNNFENELREWLLEEFEREDAGWRETLKNTPMAGQYLGAAEAYKRVIDYLNGDV